MTDGHIWYLENIDTQGIFCPQKIGNFEENHALINLKKGEFIYMPEDAADKIYYISSGRVKIGSEGSGGKTVTKAILATGEIFGELALIGEEKRRDGAVALEDTTLCVMSKDEMNGLFKDHSPFYLFIMKLIGNRVVEMERRLESLVFKDSRSRVIEFLIDLNNKKGQRVGYEWVVRKFMTHQEIANLTATSRQTVTTILNELKQRKIITFNRKRLLIRDLDQLKAEISTVH